MSKSNSDYGGTLSKGGGGNVDIISETDVWSYRHNPNNQDFVDEINTGVSRVQNDFSDIMDSVYTVGAAELGGKDKTETLGFYGMGGLALNTNYTNVSKMNKVYDEAVKEGYHPSRGKLSGVEAVTIHEMGHAVNDHISKKMGMNMDDAAATVVKNAYKATKGRGGNLQWAGKISGYAKQNYKECIAEAVADYYCNGNKAHENSKAIVNELKKYNK